jgi:hypothetical protein
MFKEQKELGFYWSKRIFEVDGSLGYYTYFYSILGIAIIIWCMSLFFTYISPYQLFNLLTC